MKKYTLAILFFIFFSFNGLAQLTDLVRIDYSTLVGEKSDIVYNRVRGLFKYPIKLKKKDTYLYLGLDYSNINLIMDETEAFDRNEINGFQLLDFNIGYVTSLKNDWRLGIAVTPGVSSNLSANYLSFEDVVLSTDVVFIKNKKDGGRANKPWKLFLGISYSGNRGFNFPLPFVSYYKKFHNKWSFNLGVPKTNLQYHISKKQRIKAYTELGGFTSNIQQGLLINGENTAKSINISLVLSGLQYEYHITDNLQFFAKSAYILSNSAQLRDKNKDNIKALDNSNTIAIQTGIKLKI